VVQTNTWEEIHNITVMPQIEFKVYASKWDKPTHVIAFIWLGSILLTYYHAVVPDGYWVWYFKNCNTASNGILTTTIITKHSITVEFFSGLKYKTELIRSHVPGKDLVIDFDIYMILQDKLQSKANGITFTNHTTLLCRISHWILNQMWQSCKE